MTNTSSTKDRTKPHNVGAERAVLAGIIRHGSALLMDLSELLTANDFSHPTLSKIFTVLRHMGIDKEYTLFETPTIMASISQLGISFDGKPEQIEELIDGMRESAPSVESTRELASVVAKLSIARKAVHTAQNIATMMAGVTGDESIDTILSTIENPVFDLSNNIINTGSDLVQMGAGLESLAHDLAAAKKDIAGLPTGFPNWDIAIGGGMRPGTVNVVGARPKVGKSTLAINIGYNLALAGVPVLYLDTELTTRYQQCKLISRHANVDMTTLECGNFDPDSLSHVYEELRDIPLSHQSIAGCSVYSVLSIARRWLLKTVGRDSSGHVKPCLIIYDYLKLMDAADLRGDMKEYQVLGFIMTQLHNFALRWDLPILLTVQLNRDGLGREGGDVLSGSDRILWLCSSSTLLKRKSPDELMEDSISNGGHKLVVTDTRYGPGMMTSEYINVQTNLAIAKMVEGAPFYHTTNSVVIDNAQIADQP